MKLEPFEIDFIIDYYESSIEYLMIRLDSIHNNKFGYDSDLTHEQIQRIRMQIDEFEERRKELKEFQKEL